MTNRQAKLKPIRGLMPDPSKLPKGCSFADRCDYAMKQCYTEAPLTFYRTEEHYVSCHLYNAENVLKGSVL